MIFSGSFRQMIPWSGQMVWMSRLHLGDFFHQLQDQRGVEQKDIGEIFPGVGHDGLADLVVKMLRPGVMLTETVTGKEDLFLGDNR